MRVSTSSLSVLNDLIHVHIVIRFFVLFSGEDLPFEKRDVTMRKDKWVTDFYTVSQLLGK